MRTHFDPSLIFIVLKEKGFYEAFFLTESLPDF